MKRKGSATVVIILFSIIFMLYATSTYADVRHLRNKHDEYEQYIIERYEIEYDNKMEIL